MFEGITDSIIGWAEGFGLLGLAVVAAIEAALPFVPPDLLVLPLVLGAQGFLAILAIVLTATISSVFGSMLGYAFGAHAGRPAFERIVSGTTVSRLESMTLRYGSAGVFLAATSPIPYVGCRCRKDGPQAVRRGRSRGPWIQIRHGRPSAGDMG